MLQNTFQVSKEFAEDSDLQPHELMLLQLAKGDCEICEEIKREVTKQVEEHEKKTEEKLIVKITEAETKVEENVLEKIMKSHSESVEKLETLLKEMISKDLKDDTRMQELKKRVEGLADDSMMKERIEEISVLRK